MSTNGNSVAVKALLDGMSDEERVSVVNTYMPISTHGLDDLQLLRPGQAAETLGVSRATLWRLEKEGALKSVEVRRGSKRFSVAELRRFAGVN